MGIRISKRTGKIHTQQSYLEEIEQVFSRIRRYQEINVKGESVKGIINQNDLLDYIQNVTGHRNDNLAREVVKTDTFRDLVEENIKRDNRTKINYTPNRFEAKENKMIFIGKNKRGQNYYYDYQRKRFTGDPRKPVEKRGDLR